MLQLIRIVFIVTGAIGGYELANTPDIPAPFSQYKIPALILCIILGVGSGYVLGGLIGRRLIVSLNWLEHRAQKLPTSDLLLALPG